MRDTAFKYSVIFVKWIKLNIQIDELLTIQDTNTKLKEKMTN